MSSARALWYVAPGDAEIRDTPLRKAREGECLVTTAASGISRGTEALVWRGRVPPSQYAAMRAPLMEGDFPFPVKYGYSAVGRTEEGRRVFVLHPHQDRFVAPRIWCTPVPDEVPDARAVLAANMETALNVTWDAAPQAGERVLVIGAGVVGLLIATLLARVPVACVTIVDINPSRAELARVFGCAFALPAEAPREQELIVHASASEQGLRLALACAAFEARLIEASWFGTTEVALPLGEAFHSRRLRLIASQVGAVAAPMRGRRTHAERLPLALRLLADPAYDALLEPAVPFEALPRELSRILDAAPGTGGLCHVITYGDA